ncbi:MAG TPA: membrane protein insertase YidC [Thermoanaerobaculia bacterium]|nr:membrane protein insertase YidC [Thermoanaerobaculia bacterium]
MEKRLFLAVLISVAFLWAWAALAPKFFPDAVKKKAVPATASASAPSGTALTNSTGTANAPTASAVTPAPVLPVPAPVPVAAAQITNPVAASELQFKTVETSEYVARFSNKGAELVSFQLRNFKIGDGSLVELVKARDAARNDFPFAIEAADANLAQRLNSALYQVSDRTENDARILEFRFAAADGVSATKTFRFTGEFLFAFSVSVTPATAPYRVAIGPGIRTLGPDEKDSQFIVTGNGVMQREDSLKVVNREKADRVQSWDAPFQFVGIEDNYFLTAIKPDRSGSAVLRRIEVPAGKDEKRMELYAAVNAAPGGVVSGSAFFGPKKTDILDRYGLEKTLQFGVFGVIGRFLLIALIWINKATKNYGYAIILLTVIIKIVLYPLQHKQIVSMKKMQKVQPKINSIRDRYKKAKSDAEQRQKMNTEMMKLYQQEGINPMSGCLPLILQLPILWGFYGLLSRAIELRGAPFLLWIHDLSAKDPYYITPILMTITMFAQQWITPTTADPAQRRMFMVMPIVFGWIFKEFPSGLVLYWLVQNVLSIVQQLIMNKYWKDHPPSLTTT